MIIGVICEGHADRAVINNIIVGITAIDSSMIRPIRPVYATRDETDNAIDNPNTKSSYSIIKQECETKELMDDFFALEDHDFMVVHIDTAEADRYGVNRPEKNNNYCQDLRDAVVNEIKVWLDGDYEDQVLHAVAIEEIDAWVLTLYENKDSTKFVDAKRRLQRLLSKLNIPYIQDPYQYYEELSSGFSKKKIISKAAILSQNCSLKLFCQQVEQMILPKLLVENKADQTSE